MDIELDCSEVENIVNQSLVYFNKSQSLFKKNLTRSLEESVDKNTCNNKAPAMKSSFYRDCRTAGHIRDDPPCE